MNKATARATDGDALAPVLSSLETSSRPSNIFQASCDDEEVVYQSTTTVIYRRGKVFTKVLLNVDDNREKRLSILEHERQVSNYLAARCPHRKVHSLNSDIFLGFSFDWIEGTTMSAWLKEHRQDRVSSDDDLMTRLNVAIAVAKSVASFHRAGVAHTNIIPENIVLSFESKACSATLIDLATAIILSDEPTSESAETFKMNDMKALGYVLHSVLGGKQPIDSVPEKDSCYQESHEDAEEVELTRKKRGKNDQYTVTNMPLYLVSLLFALIKSADDSSTFSCPYKNAYDVVTDLQEALKKPKIYLRPFKFHDGENMPVQVPKDRFYGRLSEVSMIRQSIDILKDSGGQPLVMSVSGYAGAGKSTLLKQVAKPITEINGFVITCAFDRTGSPDTVIASAFDRFFGESLPCSILDVNDSIRCSIRETLDEHVHVLEEAIPNLRAFMEDRYDRNLGLDYAVTEVTQRWGHLISKLVYAIAKKSHPVAFVFEDLHWADKDSLDTLQKIMMDRSIQYCSYYISYRDSDTDTMNQIEKMKDNVQSLGLQLYNIRVGPMGKEAANSLVSETFCIPPSLSLPLSSVIYKKTGGIILFITNFLKSLKEIGYARFSLSTCRWEFDIDSINQLEMPSDIVQHLAERIMRLPSTVQVGMQIAACLGTTFDRETFTKADSTNELSVEDFLYIVTECGFINEHSPYQYTWSHDKIKEAAYTLIPLSARESLHILVGVRIYIKTDCHELYDHIHLIVQNMNMGIRCLDERHLKTELAELNYVAGSKSADQSAFNSALNYFMIGVGLLGEDWYVTSYKLGMKLFNAAVEALLVTGNTAMFESTIHIPITCARNLEDRLSASCTWVRFLAAKSSIGEATAKCFSILREIGEDFPVEVTPQIIHMELTKTKKVMNLYSKEDFSNLPKLTDPMKLWAMQLMQIACHVAFFRNSEYILLMGCRIVQISAAYGWCSTSAFGLSTFGHGLMSILNQVDEGNRWVKVGLELVDTHLKSREIAVEMKMMYHVFIAFWKEPLQASREVLIDLSQEALLCGQIEYAMFSAFNSCRMSFICGQNIVKGEANCVSLASRMAQLRQVQSSLSLASHHNMLLTLMNIQDKSKAFALLNDNIYNEDELLDFCLKKEKLGVVHGIHLNRLILAYSFKRYDEAASMAKLYNDRKVMRFLDTYAVLFEGLTALQLARRDDGCRPKCMEIADRAIETFKTWESHSKWNFENKLLLLQAELHSVKEQFDDAEEKYKASILSARKHRFDHEVGIALNLFGEFYKMRGMEEDAKKQLLAARHCYAQWGATALANLVEL